MEKIAKVMRIAFIPPIINLLLLIISYFVVGLFHGIFILLLIVICVFPLLSYIISNQIAKHKNISRDDERLLATKFCMLGYSIGLVIMILFQRPQYEGFLVLTYFLSSIIIYICSLFNKKPSGHAAGVAGPIVYLLFVCPDFWLQISICGAVILTIVIFSSLYLKRHSILQLICGMMIPSSILVILFTIFNMQSTHGI